MSDLISRLQNYGDQIEGQVPVFSLPRDFASDGLAPPERPPSAPGRSSKRPRWLLMVIAGIGLLLLALLFAIFANNNSDRDIAPPEDAQVAPATEPEDPDSEKPIDDESDGDDDRGDDEGDGGDDGSQDTSPENADQPGTEPEEVGASETTDAPSADSAEDALPNLPCGEPEVEDENAAANQDPRSAEQKVDFTLVDVFVPPILDVIEVGGPPCHILRGGYETGAAGPQTLVVTVTLDGAPNSLYRESYDAQRRQLQIVETTSSGFVLFSGVITEHIKLFDNAPIELPAGAPVEFLVGVEVQEFIHESGVQRAFATTDERARGLAGIAPVPSVAVGVGAVWEARGGEARYEVVDVTGGVVTIDATFGGATPGTGTIWLQPESPLLTADEYFTDLSGGSISQHAFIAVNERPCLPVEVLTVPRPFGGLVRGADFETTMRRAECGFGEPSAEDRRYECTDAQGNKTQRREVTWGSLTLHFETVSGRETFIAFTFSTDREGVARPGGPPSSALDLPGPVRMGMTLAAAEALLGVAPSPVPGGDEATRIVHPDMELRAPGVSRVVTEIGVPAIPVCD